MQIIILSDKPQELNIATPRSPRPDNTTASPGMPLSDLAPEQQQALADRHRARVFHNR